MTSSLMWLSLLLAQTDAERGTLETVEGTRGGRHWIDQKTQPPKSPAESLECFEIEPGAKIELVAAEPLVLDPVAITFDHLGRMFVVEYGDYPTGPDDPDAGPLSRVVLIENALNDELPKKRHVFADGLTFAHSLMPLMDGILVGAQTQIIYLKDTDGDNVADVREVWFDGFTPAHPQMQIGNPRWGVDNRIYLNYGTGKVRMTRPGFPPSDPVDMPRTDFWFDPLTMEFGSAGGLGQFGNTIDRRGYRFFTTNRNPIMVNMIPPEAVKRNPLAIIPKTHTNVGPSGGDTRVYPLVDMKSNYLSHAGTHTSACGVTAYLGALFEGDYRDSVFVCEPIGHLVTRSIVLPDPVSSGLIMRRARPRADFLASSDTWFRPASLATGPDGALYLADMYRLWVEHPKFLPDDIAARINWRAGEDRGRIWRITPQDRTRWEYEPPKSSRDIQRHMLSSADAWRRITGQRLLVERQAKDVTNPVTMIAAFGVGTGNGIFSEPQIQALATLNGLQDLSQVDANNYHNAISHGLSSSDGDVQRVAVMLADRHFDWHIKGMRVAVERACRTATPQARLQLALLLARHSMALEFENSVQLLAELAVEDASDPWMRAAVLTSPASTCAAVAVDILNGERWPDGVEPTVGHFDIVRQLVEVTAANGDFHQTLSIVKAIDRCREDQTWWQIAAVSGLARGLPRHETRSLPHSLQQLISRPPLLVTEQVESVSQVLDRSTNIAFDVNGPERDRLVAIRLMAHLPRDRARDVLIKLLTASQPGVIRQEALTTLQRVDRSALPTVIIDNWSAFDPQTRQSALQLLLSGSASTKFALQAMDKGRLPAAVVDIDRRVRLLKHGDETIRQLAARLFGGAVSANRREVAEQYKPALAATEASVESGAAVFRRTCIKCHRIDGQGALVGPDISDVSNRSREALLFDILDPNRKVEPRFMDYTVVTTDGRTFNGLILSETPETVVLKLAEDKQQVIPRNDIDLVKASGRSLMPEGVEKDVTVQQMADLLEFLKARKRPALKAPSPQ